MKVLINGEEHELKEVLTLADLLVRFALPMQRVAIELNKTVVRRKDWAATGVNDGDQIEVVHFVGGG